MKKILSLVLAALMIFSVLPAAFAADVETIANIEEVSPYAEAVKFLNTLAVFNGGENGDLATNDLVERWMAARFIYRVATGDVAETDVRTNTNYTPFKDIDIGDFDGSSAETLGAIAWASQAKITNGVSATEFDPAAGIIYQDAITMIVRLLGERYTAASYPYGFVTTARELGVLDGITGVGLEQEITRGEFAQLLYNAMFVEIDGVSLAEKAFEVGKTTVIITASNDLVYEAGADTVLRTGKVRFAEIDAQGEPTGVEFHADAADFDLNDVKAINAAVGTLFNIYYKDTMAEIIDAESLAEVYWNLGHDAITVKAASAYTDKVNHNKIQYISIDGSTYKIVDKYTDLNRKQGETSDAEGTAEMKVYSDKGGVVSVYDSKYLIASNGSIYNTANGITEPEWYYSALVDMYYKKDGAEWIIKTPAEMEAILTKAVAQESGFGLLANADSASAYAKVTVSAGERATIREYQFGQITITTEDRYAVKADGSFGDKLASKVPSFTLKTTDSATSVNTLTQDKNGSSAGSKTAGEYFIDDYVWTGLAAPSATSYAIYYVNHLTKEIEVIEYIDGSADGDDSYTIKGYVRGFDLSKNTVNFSEKFNSAITPISFGYNALKGSPLKVTSSSNNNFNIISSYYDKYVELVIVDGKIVHISTASLSSNYVIIDSFVDFTADGVIVNGWSTVADGYTQFTVKSFNGWTVGGDFNYYAYFLSSFFGGNNASFQSMVPFETKTLYKVAFNDGDNYDLTDKGSKKTHSGLKVNEYGIIEGVKSDGTLAATNYTTTLDTDYWMILNTKGTADKTDDEVYSIKGKVNPVVKFTTGADIYVAKQDFVIVVDSVGANGEMQANDTFMGKDIAFVMYDKEVNLYYNMEYPGYTSYEYRLYMTNVLDNVVKDVKIDNKLLGVGTVGGFQANKMWTDTNLVEGKIYKAIDGVIYDLTPYTYSEVAAYYAANTQAYDDTDAAFVAGIAFNTGDYKAWSNLWDVITDEMSDQLLGGNLKGTDYFDKKVTVFFQNGDVQTKVTSSSKTADLTSFINATGIAYKMYVIINDNGTAVAWVEKVGTLAEEGSIIPTKGAYEMADSIGAWIAETDKAFNGEFTTSYSINLATGKVAVEVSYPNGISVKEGETYNGAYSLDGTTYAECEVKAVKDGDKVVGFTSEFTVAAGTKAIKQFVVAVDRPELTNADYRIEAGK